LRCWLGFFPTTEALLPGRCIPEAHLRSYHLSWKEVDRRHRNEPRPTQHTFESHPQCLIPQKVFPTSSAASSGRFGLWLVCWMVNLDLGPPWRATHSADRATPSRWLPRPSKSIRPRPSRRTRGPPCRACDARARAASRPGRAWIESPAQARRARRLAGRDRPPGE
jgi:hypothetical protein